MNNIKEWIFNIPNEFGITYAQMRLNKGKYQIDVQYNDKHFITQTLDNIDAVVLTNIEDYNRVLELLW